MVASPVASTTVCAIKRTLFAVSVDANPRNALVCHLDAGNTGMERMPAADSRTMRWATRRNPSTSKGVIVAT